MSKQEGIREGIEAEITRGIFYGGSYKNIALEILIYLHSQGVVIKAEGELPIITKKGSYYLLEPIIKEE